MVKLLIRDQVQAEPAPRLDDHRSLDPPQGRVGALRA